MKPIYVYHHLGLGDHIICNGLVRHFAKEYEVMLFVYSHNINNVQFMYRDKQNIKLISIKHDNDALEILQNLKNDIPIKKIGFFGPEYSQCKTFDEMFYFQAKLSLENRWDNFYVQRDYKKEKQTFDKLNLIENEYIFIHDDNSRNFNINIKSDNIVKIPKINSEETIFDYLMIIEKAKEIHCMNSCFLLMIDSFQCFDNKEKYFHKYAKDNYPFGQPKIKYKWNIIENNI